MPKFNVSESAAFILPPFSSAAPSLPQQPNVSEFVYRAGTSPDFRDDMDDQDHDDHDWEEDGRYAANVGMGRHED